MAFSSLNANLVLSFCKQFYLICEIPWKLCCHIRFCNAAAVNELRHATKTYRWQNKVSKFWFELEFFKCFVLCFFNNSSFFKTDLDLRIESRTQKIIDNLSRLGLTIFSLHFIDTRFIDKYFKFFKCSFKAQKISNFEL